MKKLILLLSIYGSLVTLARAESPDTLTHSSTVSEVILYPSGATIFREIEVNKKGKYVLSVNDLPLYTNPKNLQVEATGNIEILSLKSGIVVLEDQAFSSEVYLLKQIEINDSLSLIQKYIDVLNMERDLILNHDDFSNEKGNANIKSIVEAAEFYKKRLKEIEISKFDWERMKRALNKRQEANRLRHNELMNKSKKSSFNVSIQLKKSDSSPSKLTLKYFDPNATWHPFYDMKVGNINAPLKLYRKAYVSQTTGENWDKIKLTLSNSDPNVKVSAPILHPYYLHRRKSYDLHKINPSSSTAATGKILDPSGEPLIGASIVVEGTTSGTITDIDGEFNLDGGLNKWAIISYVGYERRRFFLQSGLNLISLTEEGSLLESVIIGSRSGSTDYYLDGQRLSQKKETNEERKVLNKTKIEGINSISYELAEPITLTSGNKETDLLIETEDVICFYEYLSIPSKDEKVYLQAMIPNWYKLDLLSGQANLFLNNSYKGTTSIDSKSVKDTLSISLGVDPEVIIKRKELKNLYGKKILSKNIEEKFVYQIECKNNKLSPIIIKVKDQIPLSHDKAVKVSLEKDHLAKLDSASGILEWHLELPSNSKKSVEFDYKVKYPKQYNISL